MIANIPIIRSNQIKFPRTVGLPLARDSLLHIRNIGGSHPSNYYYIIYCSQLPYLEKFMNERKNTIKDDLAEMKIVIEIMKKQIAQLEQKLGLVTIRTPLFTEEDLKEMAQMKKK